VREIDDDEPGLVVERILEALPVDRKIEAVVTAGKRHGRLVGIVGGIEHDHLVAVADDGLDGAEQALGSARAYRDFGVRVEFTPLDARDFFGDRPSESRHAWHRCVLVGAAPQVMVDAIYELGRRLETFMALQSCAS
jgi:hypothetical protein